MKKPSKKLDRFDKLLELQNYCFAEAQRCKKARAYFAGCVMLGALLEVSLLAMMELYPEEVQSSRKAPTRKGKRKPITDWALAELLDVTKDLTWLPARLSREDNFDRRKAKVGDYAEVVRQARNLIHPGRYLSDYGGKKITRKEFDLSFEILLAVSEWLQHKIFESLKKEMDKEIAPRPPL